MRTPALALFTALAAIAIASAASASAPAPPAQVAIPQQLSCHGVEPFWQLDANRATGMLQRTGGKARQVVEFRGELQPFPSVAPAALVWRGASTHLPNDTIVAMLRQEACKATSGDTPPQGWRAIVSIRAGETLAGCCTVREGYDGARAPLAAFAQKRDDDWSRRFPDLAAPIQRCVADGGVAVREVAKAWSVDADTVTVRMVGNDGKPWACTVAANARVKPKSVPVAANEPPLAGANAPVFYPARDAPLVACGRLERIAGSGARARTEGWLHYDRC
ncbi:MAG: hypothetical protein ABI585_07315 [Betaproteobacteria bacterium]